MYIKIDVNTEVEIKELTDLPKLKILMESLNVKINKSKLTRDLNVNRQIFKRLSTESHKKKKIKN